MSLVLHGMTLRSVPPATPVEHRFDHVGGSIGRAEDNDLVLPDPGRAISRVHARVEWRAGSYFLQDLGSNPSLLNGSPLGPVRSARLAHGDVLTIGDYRLQVSIDDPDAAEAPGAVSPWSTAATAPLSASRDSAAGGDGLLGEGGRREPGLPVPRDEEDWAERLGADGKDAAHFPTSPSLLAHSPWLAGPTPSATLSPPRAAATIPADFDPFALPEQTAGAPAASVPRPASGRVPRPRVAGDASAPEFAQSIAPAAAPAAVPGPAPQPGNDEVFRALLKGLGQPAVVLGKRSQADLAELAGHLLREAIDGAMGLLASNKPLTADAPHLAARDNNPLTCFPEVDGALAQMLSSHRVTYLSGPKAIWAAFETLRMRERMRQDAMEAALAEVLAHFEPAALERRMAEEGLPGGWRAGGRAAQYWERLPGAHAAIAREARAALRRADDPLAFVSDDYSAVRKNVVEP